MAAISVVVHDIDRLEEFGGYLSSKRDDIERLYDSLISECHAQEGNWNDPQYKCLQESINLFAAESKSQLEILDESVSYIARLVEKLRDM